VRLLQATGQQLPAFCAIKGDSHGG
jgi:hypothetical protein